MHGSRRRRHIGFVSRRGAAPIAEVGQEQGPMSAEELADGLARAATVPRSSAASGFRWSDRVGWWGHVRRVRYVAAERTIAACRALHAFTRRGGRRRPAPVLAEPGAAGRGQASLARLLAMCAVESMTPRSRPSGRVLAGKDRARRCRRRHGASRALRRCREWIVTAVLITSCASQMFELDATAIEAF